MNVNARVVAASRGLRWILEGARMFAGAPLGWMMLAFGYLVLTLILTRVPLVGTPLSLILYPGFTVGFMIAGRASAMRQPVEMQMLVAGFQERAREQLVLGAVYLAGVTLAILGSSLVDDGALLGVFLGNAPEGQTPAASRVGVLAALVLMLPTAMAVFFAPLLVAWHAMAPLKAVFFSFFACLLNWRAFALYLASGLVLMVVGSNLVLGLALALAGPAGRADPASLLSVLFMTMMLIALPVMMSSFYASYRDLFGASGNE